jgi:hypothetical protein
MNDSSTYSTWIQDAFHLFANLDVLIFMDKQDKFCLDVLIFNNKQQRRKTRKTRKILFGVEILKY